MSIKNTFADTITDDEEEILIKGEEVIDSIFNDSSTYYHLVNEAEPERVHGDILTLNNGSILSIELEGRYSHIHDIDGQSYTQKNSVEKTFKDSDGYCILKEPR